MAKPKVKAKAKKRGSLIPSEDSRLDSEDAGSEFETEVTATDISATEDDVESLPEMDMPLAPKSNIKDDKKPKKEEKIKAKKDKDLEKPDDDLISSEPLPTKHKQKNTKQKIQPSSKVSFH